VTNPSPVLPGQILANKYRIERVLGEGGMGVVVEAHDLGLERRVAIKFLLPNFVKHPEATKRFMREARAAVKIQSEHVARVIDIGTLENESPYMVMEFLEGSDLSQVLERSGALPVEDAALYLIQACEALAEAHAHQIIHRDLKPANLFLAEQVGGSRKIKVLDFGISKTLAATDPGLVGALTRTSSMMGSPLYMSPEQMRNARNVDPRTDVWGLGVILYEMLSGHPPFTAESIPEISAKILLEAPPPLSVINPNIPSALSEVTARALRKEPSERYPNVGALALALLPFAPQRARVNVERSLRVLSAAGSFDADLSAGLPPSDRALGFTSAAPESAPVPSSLVLVGSGLPPVVRAKAGTLANWGQTRTEPAPEPDPVVPRRRGPRRLGSLVAVSAVVALVLWFSARRGRTGDPAPTASAPRAAAAPLAAAPVEPAVRAVTPAPAPAPSTPEASAPPELAANTLTSLASPTARTGTAKAGLAHHLDAPKNKKAARAAAPSGRASADPAPPPAEKSYPGDFKPIFGSRK
jgi:serine/threonine protein kinase